MDEPNFITLDDPRSRALSAIESLKQPSSPALLTRADEVIDNAAKEVVDNAAQKSSRRGPHLGYRGTNL